MPTIRSARRATFLCSSATRVDRFTRARTEIPMTTLRIAFGALVLLPSLFARADDASSDATADPDAAAPAASPAQQEAAAARDAARRAMLRGPMSIDIRDQAKLALPSGYVYVPMPEA